MYQIAQQERHFKEITERLDDMAERLERLADIYEDWGRVKQLEKEIREQRKVIDRYVLAEPELMQRLGSMAELERSRHAKVGRLRRRLSDQTKRLNRRYTLDVEQQADAVRQRLRKERPAKLPVREVPDELLNEREADLAKRDNKIALRLLLAYKIMRRTGMRVGNLRLLTDHWFEEELKDENVRYPLIKQAGAGYCEVYLGRRVRAELQALYWEYKSRYGESPFAVGRERLTRALNDDIRKTGVPGVTSHAIRSTVVTKIVRAKGPTVAQQFMKHRSITTTARYVGNLLTPELQKGLGQLLQAGMRDETQGPESGEGQGEDRGGAHGPDQGSQPPVPGPSAEPSPRESKDRATAGTKARHIEEATDDAEDGATAKAEGGRGGSQAQGRGYHQERGSCQGSQGSKRRGEGGE
jgi:hypothetical protein